MHDWMFEPGQDPLLMTVAEQPWSSEQDAANWFAPEAEPVDEFEIWLFETPTKGDLDDFGPMFSGAVELGEVVVRGTRMERMPTAMQVTIGDHDEWTLGEVGGGGGGWFPPPDVYDPCEDRAADTLADDINDEIARQPDSDRVEYGALIWRDDSGQLHHTSVTPGNNGHWIPPSAPTGGGFHSWSQVVGYVHSHPTQVYQNNQWVAVPPESHFDRPSSGDWQTADFYIGQGASAENFTVYISYNGQIREFDSRMNTSQSRSTAPMPGHGTESGTYLPGTSCP